MFLRLLLLFTVVPIIELVLLVELGRATSLATTLAVVLLTGFLGAWLARLEGLRTWTSIQRSLQDGRVLTAGGRVLCAVGLGDGIADAQRAAYALINRLCWQGMQYRRDIGWRAIGRQDR